MCWVFASARPSLWSRRAAAVSAPWAIVPVKILDTAKQRLAGVLPLEARRRLMLTMLRDVLATLRQVKRLGSVLVVTPDAQAAEVALACGALVLREERAQGHTEAAMAGLRYARSHGAAVGVTLPADAPCVTPDEIGRVIEAGVGGPHPCVALVPARDGDGTNAVLAAPPDVFPLSFGPGSFARHLAAAEAQRLSCGIVELPGLAMDIDEPRDLAELMARKLSDPCYAFLWNDGGRVREMAVQTDRS